jgi:hypothetical protein
VPNSTEPSMEPNRQERQNGATGAFQMIDVVGDVVSMNSFKIRSADVASYMIEISEEERPHAMIRAIEVGVFCLERASTSQNTDFVKRQVDRLLADMGSKVAAIPAAVREQLLIKVGAGKGQILEPVVEATIQVIAAVNGRITEVKNLFTDELDPGRNESALGKALKHVKDLLNPALDGSVQKSIDLAIASVTGEKGALSKAVKEVVAETIDPLRQEIEKLGREIRGQEAAQDALMQTTLKGIPYEEKIVDELQLWAKATGAHLEHVGADNHPGDIVLTMTASSVAATDFRLVIEARDHTSPKGRKAVSNDLSIAMSQRTANAAIYLSHTAAGLGREIGDWCEGRDTLGPWIATTHNHLHTAVRFLIANERLCALRSESPQFDGSAIETQIQRIRTSMQRVTQIKAKVTDIRSAADGVKSEADMLQDEMRGALNAIEDAISKAPILASPT